MDRALWFLLWLRLAGWFRRMGLNLRTVKGALLAVLGGGMLLLWLGSLVISAFLPGQQPRSADPEQVRLYGPLILLAYCVLTSAFSAGERAVTFSPAEVNFLFTGPFSRRQLLLYKIVGTFLTSLLTAVFLTLVLVRYASSLLTAVTGLLLGMLFLQLFAMAAALIASVVGAQAYTRRRRIVLLVLLVLLAAGLLQAGQSLSEGDAGSLLRTLAESPTARIVLSPLRWFVETFTAEELWPDYVLYSLLSLLVDGVLVAIVLGLDAHYLEAAAAASEKTYARLQRLRTGGAAAAWGALSGKARFSLPDFPRLGGVGPIAWRQMVTATRGLKGLLIFLLFLGLTMVWPIFTPATQTTSSSEMANIYLSTLLGLCVFALPMMLTFDFRGDVDRIDLLKTLPLASWRLTVGQILTPTILISLIQLVLVLLLHVIWGGLEHYLIGVVVFALPVNFLLFAIENLVFLLFPTRQMAVTPGDFQVMGRHMLLFIAKFLILGFTFGTAFLAGTVAYLITNDYYVAAAACWPIFVAVDLALIPLLAVAFKRFDVARDTPP
jgi:hypothetical protein